MQKKVTTLTTHPITPLDAWIKAATGLREINEDAMREYHLLKLRKLLVYVKARSRFYREKLREYDDINSLEEFYAFPFTLPSDISADPNSMACVPPDNVSRIITLRTSGTTGSKKRILFTHEDQELTLDFFVHGMSTFTAPGDMTLLFMPGDAPGGVSDLLARALGRLGANSMTCGLISDYHSAADLLYKYRPGVVVGFPSQIMRLARETAGLVKIGSVLLVSDNMPPALLEAISFSWGCEVYTHYGLTETGLGGAVSCSAHDGYHMRENDLYFEIVDSSSGVTVPDGEFGEVCVTTLNHRGMPLVRYLTGDRSRIITLQCSCGSNIRRLGRITGRINENTLLSSGEEISIATLDDLLYRYSSIVSFKADIYSCDSAVEKEVLVITVKLEDKAEALPVVPELDTLPVRVLLVEGEPDNISTGVDKRTINDFRGNREKIAPSSFGKL